MNMAEFRYDIVKDPEIFMENRLSAHSDHEYYSSKEAAGAGVSDYKYSLNGIWRICICQKLRTRSRGFLEN